jgi:hypothetical protein
VVIGALKTLPKILKISLKKEKTLRNNCREATCLLHISHPKEFLDEGSDTFSLITVSDTSESTHKSLLSFLSPTSKDILGTILKRFHNSDSDNSPEHVPKKRLHETLGEVQILPGNYNHDQVQHAQATQSQPLPE